MTASTPIGNRLPTTSAHTLPTKRSTDTSGIAPTQDTAKPATPARSLPPHLGTTIDTTA